jgi:hypothetical protein
MTGMLLESPHTAEDEREARALQTLYILQEDIRLYIYFDTKRGYLCFRTWLSWIQVAYRTKDLLDRASQKKIV